MPCCRCTASHDPMVLPESVDGSEAYVRAPYERVDLDVGHFPHEEDPTAFTAALTAWLSALDRP